MSSTRQDFIAMRLFIMCLHINQEQHSLLFRGRVTKQGISVYFYVQGSTIRGDITITKVCYAVDPADLPKTMDDRIDEGVEQTQEYTKIIEAIHPYEDKLYRLASRSAGTLL